MISRSEQLVSLAKRQQSEECITERKVRLPLGSILEASYEKFLDMCLSPDFVPLKNMDATVISWLLFLLRTVTLTRESGYVVVNHHAPPISKSKVGFSTSVCGGSCASFCQETSG